MLNKRIAPVPPISDILCLIAYPLTSSAQSLLWCGIISCLICVGYGTKICGKLMVPIALCLQSLAIHHITHSLVFLHLAVNSFSTIGIRLAGVPVCNILRNIGNRLPGILSGLTDIIGNITSPISSTRNGVTDIADESSCGIADVLSSTGHSSANVSGLLTNPVACITCGILDFITHVLAKVITCPFSHSWKSPIVLSTSFIKLGAHAVSTVSDILRIETLEIFICVSTGNELADVSSLITDPVTGILSSSSNRIAYAIEESSDSAASLFCSLADSVTNVLSCASHSTADIPGLIADPVASILSRSTDVLRCISSPVTHGIRSSTDSIANVLGGVTSPVANILSSSSNSITHTVEESSDSAASLFSCLPNSVADVLSSLTYSVADVLSSLTDSIADVLSSVLHVTGGIADPLTSAVEKTGSALGCVRSGFRGSILDVIGSTAHPLPGTVKESLGTFSGFIGGTGYSVTDVLSCLAYSVAYVLSGIRYVFTSSRPQCDIRCFLGSTRDGIANILSSLAYSIGNIVCGSGNLLPRSVIVLCLVCVRRSSEIGSKLMIASTFIVHAVVIHHIAHSLVFLHLAVDSFSTISIRLASIPVRDVLSSLTYSVADVLGSIGNSPSKILSGRSTVADGIIDNAINCFSGRIRNILKGFSSILSGLSCKVLNALSSARQRILGRIDRGLCNARQGLGLLLVIVVRGSLLSLLRITHHSSCRTLILVLLPVLIAGDKVRALIHSGPGSHCSIGDALGHILSDVSSESPDILAGVLQPLDVAIVSIDSEFVLIPFHALHTVVLEAVFAVKWNASDVVFSHVHAPPFEG